MPGTTQRRATTRKKRTTKKKGGSVHRTAITKTSKVKGYTRSDGTRVKGFTRTIKSHYY